MPTYEYECTHCGHRFDKFQSISAPSLKRCPKCRHKVKRLLGAGGGLIFKGTGFYVTDYRSDTYRKAQSADKVGSAEKKSTGSTESKPAAATTGKKGS